MKKVLTLAITAGLMAGSAVAGSSLSVDFATAHIFRGQTVIDELVVQPGVELYGFGMPEEYGEIAAGVWGSTAPFNDDSPSLDSVYETDWYINYSLPQIVEGVDLSVGYTEYQYSFGADEKELNFGGGYAISNLYLGASANFMIDDRNLLTEDQIYLDFFADYALEVSDEVDVNFGGLISYMIQGDGYDTAGLDDGFNHYEIYGAFNYALGEMWSLGASLAYIGQLDDDVLIDAFYDKGLIAMFSVNCEM